MKILHVNNHFHLTGGSEQYLFSICAQLKQLGHQNVILHGSSDGRTEEDHVESNYMIPELDHFDRRIQKEMRARITSVVQREKPDLAYLHNLHNPMVVNILAERGPVIKYVHDHEVYCPKKVRMLKGKPCSNSADLVCLINAFRGDGYRCMGRRDLLSIARETRLMMINKRAHRKINGYIVASRHMKENLISRGYDENRIKVIPYFTEIPDDIPMKKSGKNILFVGRLIYEKGLDFLIETLRFLKEDFRLTIIGEGEKDYMDSLQRKVSENHLQGKVEFVGWVDNRDLRHYFSKSAFAVVPSIWPEPFGIVGIEAMAHGLPVVAFNVGGISDWLEDGRTGFLIGYGDQKTFADKMERLLREEALRLELGGNAYKRAASLYQKSSHVQRLVSLFHEVAQREE